MNHRVIGLSGVAGSGKDMFYSLLKKKLHPFIQRFALADVLKEELQESIQKLYGIDILNCSRKEKDLVRPVLVAHGKVRRESSHGTYWTSILTNKIGEYLEKNPSGIACVTDVRYDVFQHDEISWLKDTMNGYLVHIALRVPDENGKLVTLEPPNQDEKENDPRLIAKADYCVEWPKLISTDLQYPNWEELNPYVEAFLKKFNG